MKTYESTPSFAVAKRRVPLAKIDASGSAAAEKMGRVLATAGGRPTQISTFNSSL
ncbi:FxSxx-COOH cyclophane-containing RiPP peptide [Streptomyces sp. NPDC006175]|uniref:FxSxx-COOH cyclophane-containing RiPP peptide n=1 Tax=unclassified Streptomyces TaxID=2593676 RepID=UPI000CF25A0A|nr:FxSxx-COOH cyclophane-containing RiPP peptide [Streptomyces sp. QL37]PPQ60752.1 FXSXX-COOH protein [Streptomyces sp. QL37]